MTRAEIETELSRIIDSLILDKYPRALDDDQVELLQDGDERNEAINELQEMIEFYREDL